MVLVTRARAGVGGAMAALAAGGQILWPLEKCTDVGGCSNVAAPFA